MWQIANRPEIPECPCASFFDPEVGGAWRERGGRAGHHPLCQFDRTVGRVWDIATKQAEERESRGENPQARPDEWLRIREEVASRG